MAQNFIYARIGKPVDTTCSCTQCNNDNCLGKRQDINNKNNIEACSCETCLEPATCLFYNKNKNRSVGCGTAISFTLVTDIGDGYESKFQTCCDGKRKLVAPGHVFELRKYCTERSLLATKKSESSRRGFELPISATPKCESCAYILGPSKENDYKGKNEKKSNKNACMLNECIQKLHAEVNSHECCHTSAKKKYKSPASVLEQQECKNSNLNELPGIVYDLTKFSQNLQSQKCTSHKLNESAKIKSDSFVCMTVSPKTLPECDKFMDRNEYESPNSEHGRTNAQTKKFSQHKSCDDSSNAVNLAKYVLDLQKKKSEYSDNECYKCTRTNKNESKQMNGFEARKRSYVSQCNKCSERNGHELSDQTKWVPKPLVQAYSCSCYESANNKPHTYVLEPLTPQAQKNINRCCDSAKKKLELPGYVLELPINLHKQNDCERNKFKKLNEYEPMKCTAKSQAQKKCHYCGHGSVRNNGIALDLRKIYSEHSNSECHKCARMNENDSLTNANEPKKCTQKLETQKSSCERDCCHHSANHKSPKELPKCSQQKTHRQNSTKSTTTCSLECCPKQEKKHAQPPNPQTIRELMLITSSLSEIYNRKSKESTTRANMCNSMTETSSCRAVFTAPCCEDLKEESTISSPAAVYAAMVEKQKQQNSVVDLLKCAYLPQNCLTESMPKKKCVCKHNQQADQTKGSKMIISNIPCKRSQELVIRKPSFKEPDITITKSCSCKKGTLSSAAKTSNQELKTSVVESRETDYVTICTEYPKKKLIAEKCMCKHKEKEKNKIIDSNENIQNIYWNTNKASQNAFYGTLRDKQGSLDYLHDISNSVELPKMLSKKDKKLDTKKQGSKENQIDIQYIPYKRPTCCNNETVIAGLHSNALCLSLSDTDQDINTLKCNTLSEISKTSSSKTKSAQGSEKNLQLFNKKRFASDTMHIFYNTNSECNEIVKNKFETPRYFVKSQQYTPTKNAQELFKNILQTNRDEIETLINRYQKKPGESNTSTKDIESRSSRNLTDLPESSLISIKQSLSARNNSKPSKCLSNKAKKLYTYRTSSHDPTSNVKDFSINRCETNMITSFHCKDVAKQRRTTSGYECGSCISTAQNKYENKNGYVFELPKYMHNAITQKKACKCPESAKNKFESSGYLIEVSNNDNHEKKKCACYYESAKHKTEKQVCGRKINSELTGYVLDLTKPIQKCNSSSSTQSAKKLSKCGHNKQKCNSCSSTQSAKKLSKCGHDTQKSNSNSSTQSAKKPLKCGHNKQKCNSCSSTQLAKKLSKCGHNTSNNDEYLSILKLVSKSVQSDTENICKNRVGTQTDVFENLFLQNAISENAIELCKDILKTQIHTIEVLKKIYFPQYKNTNSNRTSELSQNTCSTLPNSIVTSDNINTNKNRTLQPEVLTHISYTELDDSLACKQSNISIKPKKYLSKYDIIQKLKEAYKACSCKICECVTDNAVGKPDACKCKPCECIECTSLFLSHETNERQICDCKPCDCVQCTKFQAEQLRNDSSQTSGYKTTSCPQPQTLVVAPVEIDDTVSHLACTCSPCACVECGVFYPLGSTLINDVSTSTNRHALCRCEVCLNENCDRNGIDSCKCQMRNKFMTKPVEQDTHDFDIRTAMVVHNTPMSQWICKNDPVAMFAAVPNTYPTIQNRTSITKTNSCKECETFCVSRKDSIKSSQLLSNTSRTKSDYNNRIGNCEFKLPSVSQLNKEIQNHKYIYDKYSSLNCEIKSLKYSSNEPHTFERYQYHNDTYGPSFIKETSGNVTLPFKKGEVLTPSTHKLKVQNQILQKQRLEASNANTDSSSNQQDFNIFHELTTTEWNASNKIGSITKANMYMNDFKTKYVDKCKTLKYDAYMYYQKINKKRSLYKNEVLENVLVPESRFSDHSSSCFKDYGSKTQITQSNDKPRETFSSCHKYPEYLIQNSQKGIITTSLKDVMQLDINETKRLDNCNFIPSNIEKHNIDKIYESMSGVENCFKINNNSDNALIETMCRNYKYGLSNNLSNKNENKRLEINGIQNKEKDQLQGTCLTGSQYSVKINNENHEYIKAINDLNEFHVAHKVLDYNMAARHSLTIHDEHSDLFTSTEILNANDYRRVKNTLNEARDYSHELIRLLKTYEKANNEFQSISHKLKLSHESRFSSDFVQRFSSHTQKQHKL